MNRTLVLDFRRLAGYSKDLIIFAACAQIRSIKGEQIFFVETNDIKNNNNLLYNGEYIGYYSDYFLTNSITRGDFKEIELFDASTNFDNFIIELQSF